MPKEDQTRRQRSLRERRIGCERATMATVKLADRVDWAV
jgi:hypothetical protein